MHEASVAQSLLETMLQVSQEHVGVPTHAKVSCGQLNALNAEVFQVAFTALAEGTVCEGIVFEIEQKPFRATCAACEHVFEVESNTETCPACQNDSFGLLPDAPLLLETITFDE